jgi:hypothetical protein
MSIGDSITLVSCLAGLMLALPAFLVFLSMTFNRTTTRAAERISGGWTLIFFMGLIPIVVIGFLAGVLVSLGSIFQLIGAVIYLFLLLWMFSGVASFSRLIGARISEFNERETSPLVETIVGAFILSFAMAFPLVGWFLLLPLTLVIGAGAVASSWFNRSDRASGASN